MTAKVNAYDENGNTYRIMIEIGMINSVLNKDDRGRMRDNCPVRQLQFFTTAELAGMRDRTASRNYSAERDEFRREHERQRDWGQCHVA